jgi:regulator of protease activity HflC (stomatin/prohibitin superfamily)
MKRATAETEAQNKVLASRAWAEAHMIEAEARAKSTKLQAEAAAEAIRVQAAIDSDINDEFARTLASSRVEVERTKAYGTNTVFAPIEALNNGGLYSLGLVQNAASGRKA